MDDDNPYKSPETEEMARWGGTISAWHMLLVLGFACISLLIVLVSVFAVLFGVMLVFSGPFPASPIVGIVAVVVGIAMFANYVVKPWWYFFKGLRGELD